MVVDIILPAMLGLVLVRETGVEAYSLSVNKLSPPATRLMYRKYIHSNLSGADYRDGIPAVGRKVSMYVHQATRPEGGGLGRNLTGHELERLGLALLVRHLGGIVE